MTTTSDTKPYSRNWKQMILSGLGAGGLIALTMYVVWPNMQTKTQAQEKKAAHQVATSAEEICPIKVGTSLPKITLRTAADQPFDLNASIAKKPAVLVFYRGGWCPFCNLQMAQLRDVQPQLEKLGYQLLAVSTDHPQELDKSTQKQELKYTLLSDSKMQASQALGIAFEVDEATVSKYKGAGLDLEKVSGERHHLLPVPSVFVVGTDGIINFSYVNPNYKVRLAPEVLLAAAKAALPQKEQPVLRQ